MLKSIGLDGEANETRRLTALRALDKYDRLGLEAVQALLGQGRKDKSGDFTRGAELTEAQIIRLIGVFRRPPTLPIRLIGCQNGKKKFIVLSS